MSPSEDNFGDNSATDWRESQLRNLRAAHDKLLAAIKKHHAQKADDRCWMDDNVLYEAAGLPPDTSHRCVGDKGAMRKNCDRFIDLRVGENGEWKSYAELEAENAALKEKVKQFEEASAAMERLLDKMDN